MTQVGPRVAAIVLAAGQGTRYAAQSGGAFKLLASLKGVPLVRHVVQAALHSRAAPVIVVTGHERERVSEALAGLACVTAHNPAFTSGLSSSLKAGVTALSNQPVDGILVLLADMPQISAALCDRLITAFSQDVSVDAALPVHEGQRGNPVLLGRSLFGALERLSGDEGARRILATATRVVEVPVTDDAVSLDIDTPAALILAQNR